MKIAVSGSHGFIGSALRAHLEREQHEVIPLVRKLGPEKGEQIVWDPETGYVETKGLIGVDAVIHLAGENVFGPWTRRKKKRIRSSRVQGTRWLCEAIASMEKRPRHFFCAGAIGFYGNRGDEELTEDSQAGQGFLAEVCQAWEGATSPARNAGVRVVNMRFGVVLHPSGGALKTMLVPFRLGIGGPLGNGNQYFSWVTRDDLCRAISFLLEHTDITGSVNVVAPQNVTNRELTRVLGKVLKRPTRLKVPAVLLRGILGELADEMLLTSTRVRAKVLQEGGFGFRDPNLEEALTHLLGLTNPKQNQNAKHKQKSFFV